MNTKAHAHFQNVDPILFSYIGRVEILEVSSASTDYFFHLCDAIISQQLSVKAGETILNRFKKLFPEEKVTPEKLVKIPDQTIRDVGCSWAKIKSLKDLAEKVLDGTVNLEEIDSLSDEEVIEHLIKVRGIGRWTAEMFLMFALQRENVFSHGDLGLRRAIQKIYNFKNEPTKAQIEKIVKKWSPYKTYACRVLWKTLLLKD